MWLTTIGGIDWPSSHSSWQQRQELTAILDQLRQANINTVMFQARVRASTVFPCADEPWDVCITGTPGQSPGYDPLQFCIDECHKRGMQCHAWIVTIPVGKWNTNGCKQIRQRFPNLIRKIGDEGYMNPEMPQTGDYLARFCAEVTRRYDVDGIHLDYIRYPETWKLKVSRDQGRQYITDIVRKINRAVKSVKPWVMLSCSPIGKFDDLSRYRSSGWNAYTTVCQDAQGWLRSGLMDALFPMMYFQGNNFYPFAVDWKQHSYGRIVAPGLAVYMLHPREKNWPLEVVTREILIPPMTWAGRQAPLAVSAINVRRGINHDFLSWNKARDLSGGDYLLYNIYASEQYPVDVTDARNLVVTRCQQLSVSIPHKGRSLNYAVTATDRYGNESTPTGSISTNGKMPKNIDFRQLIMGNSLKKYK